MDRTSLAEKFKVDKLEDYIIREFHAGKVEAEIAVKDYLEKVILDVQKTEDTEVKFFKIIDIIISNKTTFYDVEKNYFSLIIRETTLNYGLFQKETIAAPEKFALFFLDYLDLKNLSNRTIGNLIGNVRKDSNLYHSNIFFKSNSDVLFELLNSLDLKQDSYQWGWTNVEVGLVLLLKNQIIRKRSDQDDFEFKFRSLENKNRSEISKLDNEIKNLNSSLKQSINKFTFYEEANKKYYYNSAIIINDTYFGDNMPFLFNLYAFLRSYNLIKYSWSYFYLCMNVDNNEMIFLEKSKKLNFLGRIFFHLGSYLIIPYNENVFQFIMSKFLINEKRIEPKFKNNHMSPDYDKTIEKELVKVDNFFKEQDKIYSNV